MARGIPSATPFDALVAQRFKIEIEGVAIASFAEVGGTISEIEVATLKANDPRGKPIVKMMIGATKPPTITLKRGADASMDLWNWHKAALDGAITGARKDGSIVQYDFAGGEVARYNFYSAWISKYEVTGMKAGDNTASQENITMVCERFEKV